MSLKRWHSLSKLPTLILYEKQADHFADHEKQTENIIELFSMENLRYEICSTTTHYGNLSLSVTIEIHSQR